jgi:integrase
VTGPGAHIRCDGRRKQRSTPLRQEIAKLLDVWLKERGGYDHDPLFTAIRVDELSRDALERVVYRHTQTAARPDSILPAWMFRTDFIPTPGSA